MATPHGDPQASAGAAIPMRRTTINASAARLRMSVSLLPELPHLSWQQPRPATHRTTAAAHAAGRLGDGAPTREQRGGREHERQRDRGELRRHRDLSGYVSVGASLEVSLSHPRIARGSDGQPLARPSAENGPDAPSSPAASASRAENIVAERSLRNAVTSSGWAGVTARHTVISTQTSRARLATAA